MNAATDQTPPTSNPAGPPMPDPERRLVAEVRFRARRIMVSTRVAASGAPLVELDVPGPEAVAQRRLVLGRGSALVLASALERAVADLDARAGGER